jgi:hypothetical protein
MRDEMTEYRRYVDDIRLLLATWQASGVEVFLKLRDAESTGIWKLTKQHTSFQDFLTREFPDVIGLHQYTHVIRMIEEYGVDFAKKVGVHAAHAVINDRIVSSPSRKAEVVAAVEHHIKRDGCAPGLPKVREIARSVAPETRKPCSEVKAARLEAKAQSDVDALRARVKELEAALAEKEREVARLQAENEKLRAAVVVKAKPAAKKAA